MKKSFFVLALMLASVSILMAQHVKKTSVIKEEEVPVAVRVAFQVDFGKIPSDGSWTVAFHVLTEGNKTTAKPVSYTFAKRSKSEKIEVRYTPEGKLEFAKGLEKVNANT